MSSPIIKHFTNDCLSLPPLQEVSGPICDLAREMEERCRLLSEIEGIKDCLVRAKQS